MKVTLLKIKWSGALVGVFIDKRSAKACAQQLCRNNRLYRSSDFVTQECTVQGVPQPEPTT